ncbi:hypothetical protein F4561_003029 [Lipingzhangella halophila]|uniref:Uncharacterized protein n=1 Tax=Lipingzhangella halophila TaxID=1783352 RepID=A0A7W7RHS9_9ACTN|nr:hypothetical protein [Lipingzhangella halophila]
MRPERSGPPSGPAPDNRGASPLRAPPNCAGARACGARAAVGVAASR